MNLQKFYGLFGEEAQKNYHSSSKSGLHYFTALLQRVDSIKKITILLQRVGSIISQGSLEKSLQKLDLFAG